MTAACSSSSARTSSCRTPLHGAIGLSMPGADKSRLLQLLVGIDCGLAQLPGGAAANLRPCAGAPMSPADETEEDRILRRR